MSKEHDYSAKATPLTLSRNRSWSKAVRLLDFVPQVFFDLIARVGPGALMLVIVPLALGTSLPYEVSAYLAPLPVIHRSPTAIAVLLAFAAWLVGHMVSPACAFLELRMGSDWKQVQQSGDERKKEVIRRADIIRVKSPPIGARIVKLRAEYLMYASSFAVLSGAAILHLICCSFEALEFSPRFMTLDLAAAALFWFGMKRRMRQYDVSVELHFEILATQRGPKWPWSSLPTS